MVILAVAVFVPALPAGASHTSLDEVRQEIAANKAKLASLVNDDQQVVAILNQITARLNSQRAELASAQATLDRIKLQIRTEQRRLRKLKAKARNRQAVIDARARALYIAGPINGFLGLTDASSFGDNLNRAGMLEYVASFDKQMLEDLRGIREDARRTRAGLMVQKESASAVRDEIAERVAVVAELAATQQQAHNQLSSKIQGYRNEIAALEREQARIQAIILQRSQSGSVNTGGSSALGFAWPIRGPITSPYGPRWGGFHTGMDIDCTTGDRIGASKAGRVIEAGWGGGYGNMIIIDHGGGYSTLYAHMSRLYKGRGATVAQHEAIGACGTTGNSTGDHLHFEVRVNGQHRDPRPYLP